MDFGRFRVHVLTFCRFCIPKGGFYPKLRPWTLKVLLPRLKSLFALFHRGDLGLGRLDIVLVTFRNLELRLLCDL